jgi:transposase
MDQGGLFSYIAPDKRVPAKHPLRKVRELVRDVLSDLNRSLGRLYASEGRPSIPPEQLLSALLPQVFYGIRSERQLMEQLDYNLLYRWFAGLSPDDPVWDPTTFTKNRERLQNGDVFAKFMTLRPIVEARGVGHSPRLLSFRFGRREQNLPFAPRERLLGVCESLVCHDGEQWDWLEGRVEAQPCPGSRPSSAAMITENGSRLHAESDGRRH